MGDSRVLGERMVTYAQCWPERWDNLLDVQHDRILDYVECLRSVKAMFFNGSPESVEAAKLFTKDVPDTEVFPEGILHEGLTFPPPVWLMMGQVGALTFWSPKMFEALYERQYTRQ